MQTEFQEYPFAGFAGTGYDVGLPSEVKAVDCGQGEEGGEGGTCLLYTSDAADD